ncbi:hypothetical protein Tco_1119206, partial [Tanacetum coccineum]
MNKDKRVRFVEPVTSLSNIPKQTNSLKTKDSNKPLLTSTGVKPTTSARRSKPSGNTKNNRITRPPSSNQKNKVEDHSRKIKSTLNKKNSVSEPISNTHVNHSVRNAKNILNHVETFATFDALDNVLSGYGPGCNVPSISTPLASCSSRIIGLYLDVFQKCSEFCGVKSQRECSTTFRVINRTEDAQLYLDVYRKYSRVSRKVPCVQQGTGLRGSSPFVGGVGEGLNKRQLQPSGHSDVFEAYLALCSSGVGSRRSRSLSQITTVFNSNLVHTDFSSLCGPSASLPGRNFHANPNAVMITGVSNNGSSASRRGRNVQIDESINAGRGSYVFKVYGQIYHWIGSLCPPAGEPPRFLQLYIYDTNNEVQNRMHHFGGIDNSQLEPKIVE